MRKKRPKPSEVAVSSTRCYWYKDVSSEDRKWVEDIIHELSKLRHPGWNAVATAIIEELNLDVSQETLIRYLLRKVAKCRKKPPQK